MVSNAQGVEFAKLAHFPTAVIRVECCEQPVEPEVQISCCAANVSFDDLQNRIRWRPLGSKALLLIWKLQAWTTRELIIGEVKY